ncbi:MAG TPA: S8 family serine peptidase [Actinomycetota bacterium]|nr:S8 family serine peptidase [Actinomycetota bacterium]
MKRTITTFLAATVLMALMVPAPQPAEAQATCTLPPGFYDSGGSLGFVYPNDPLYSAQWGLRRIDIEVAWIRGASGKGARVAVLDTGLDYRHPDLLASAGPGIDLIEELSGTPDCPGAQDETGHGTAVSGIIAAGTNNGIGIAGIAPKAKLLPIRVSGPNGLNASALVEGIRRATARKADVIFIGASQPAAPLWAAGGAEVPAELDAAIAEAWDKGAVLIAPAGDDSLPFCEHPAAHPRVVCVAAVAQTGVAPYSNLPVHPGAGVALRAPGGMDGRSLNPVAACEDPGAIWTTTLAGSSADCGGAIGGYDTDAGTAFAAAHVAGVAALLAGWRNDNEQIVTCLQSWSSNEGIYDPVMGYGEVDANAATINCPKRRR